MATSAQHPLTDLMKLLVATGCVLTANGTNAQLLTEEENFIRGSIFAGAQYVENATGVAESEVQIDEKRFEYGATLESLWRSGYTGIELDYRVTESTFDEQSQADDSYWEGDSRFALGNQTTNYEFLAFHSVRRVLNSPDAPSILLTNSQDREIYGVSPSMRARLGQANTLTVTYNDSEVAFGDSDSNDSSREGFDIVFTRLISAIHQLSVVLAEREIDYKTSDIADYQTESISALMVAEHRNYDYQLQIGATTVDPFQGADLTELTGSFQLNTRVAGNTFSVFAEHSISDSSQGSGNNSFFSTEITFDGAISERDQIIRSAVGVGWAYDLLCNLCSLSVNVGFEENDYVNLSINDIEQTFYELTFGYQFSDRLTARVSSRYSETDFLDRDALSPDTDSNSSRVELNYLINRLFSISLFHERDERDVANDDGFDVGTTSLRATLLLE